MTLGHRYVVAVRWRGVGPWRRVYLARGGGYTLRFSQRRAGTFSGPEAVRARAWARSKGHAFRASRLNPYPFLVLDSDTRPVVAAMMAKLNALGRGLRRVLRIREGTRTRKQQQAFWDAFVARGYRPPLVAKPGTSNHEARNGEKLGRAADVGALKTGQNVGAIRGARALMRKLGLCLPVPGEDWHVEEGSRWRA